jgi:hypothetical protein
VVLEGGGDVVGAIDVGGKWRFRRHHSIMAYRREGE